MKEDLTNEFILLSRFNDAIEYLNTHDSITVTCSGIYVDVTKNKFSKDLMIQIIDIVDAIKMVNGENNLYKSGVLLRSKFNKDRYNSKGRAELI